ncbi:MAG: TIGR02186 family protein [Chakrabartia sp.]
MKFLLRCLLVPFLLLTTAASNPVLVPDVSQRKIDIVYSFTGAELLLFGAILYPGGRVPSRDANIVVVLRGPSQSLIVREKRKLGGLIWVNAESTQFRSAPGFYAVAGSKPLSKLVDERTAAIYELGLGSLHLSPASGKLPEAQRRFEKGFVDLLGRADLYTQSANTVEITDGVLYRARLTIPARVPVGTYTAETFLIRDGRVLAAATRDIEINKSGFERYIAEWSQAQPFSYGMAAVFLSLLLGWGASALFRRI